MLQEPGKMYSSKEELLKDTDNPEDGRVRNIALIILFVMMIAGLAAGAITNTKG